MKNMVQNVEAILKEVKNNGYDDVQFLFENTAGQGSEIGSTLEELSYFRTNYLHDLPVKFCLDTAHCRGGGIDLHKRGQFVTEFAEQVGLEQLYSIHLNDAKVPLWAHLDRHASLGYGFIGWPVLVPIIQWAATNDRHLYIETPKDELRSQEIDRVRQIAEGDVEWVQAVHEANYCSDSLKKFIDHAEQERLF